MQNTCLISERVKIMHAWGGGDNITSEDHVCCDPRQGWERPTRAWWQQAEKQGDSVRLVVGVEMHVMVEVKVRDRARHRGRAGRVHGLGWDAHLNMVGSVLDVLERHLQRECQTLVPLTDRV